MGDYVITCCSTVDTSIEHLKSRNVSFVSFHYSLNDTTYPDDFGKTLKPAEIYKRMVAGEDAKTSQVGVGEYEEFFEPFLKEGKDILHVTLSSGISGTFNSANLAKNMLEDKYPDRKIYVVDSLAASGGYGLLVDGMCDKRDEGLTIDELRDWTEENKLRLNHWFFTSDLTFFIKGGRVSKAAGTIGTMLNICPLLNVDYMGRLINREKVRTKKKVIKRAVEKMEELCDDGLDYSQKCYITNADCIDDAKAVAGIIEEKFTKMNGKVQITDIGATIGCHTGPGCVALFFWGKKRED